MIANRIKSETATRYIWSALYDLTFFATQAFNPVCTPVIKKRKITPIFPITYWAKNDNKNEATLDGADDLIEYTMGTDAQVNFILGDIENGNFAKGVCTFISLIDSNVDEVMTFESTLFPNNIENLTLFELDELLQRGKKHVNKDKFRAAIDEMRAAVSRAIGYCTSMIAEIESEIADSKTGRKLAFKTKLMPNDIYLYEQIGKTVPNFNDEKLDLTSALKKALGMPEMTQEDKELLSKLQFLEEENKRLKAMLKKSSKGEDKEE